jgi:hypothetical protein
MAGELVSSSFKCISQLIIMICCSKEKFDTMWKIQETIWDRKRMEKNLFKNMKL